MLIENLPPLSEETAEGISNDLLNLKVEDSEDGFKVKMHREALPKGGFRIVGNRGAVKITIFERRFDNETEKYVTKYNSQYLKF